LRALIRGPCSDEIPLGDQKLDRLDRIGKNSRILTQEFLDLIKIPSLNTWGCFAMADDIRCDEVVKRVGLNGCSMRRKNAGLRLCSALAL
jgi:hypothetical protein